MRIINVVEPGGLDNLVCSEQDTPSPGKGEVLVRWHASSLNYHDYLVASGAWPVTDGRCPLSDGAGEIVAVGNGVSRWQTGDRVMGLFFPKWLEGPPSAETMADFAGDTVDGYAREFSCLNADSVSRIPQGYSFAEAATLPCAGLTAWRALIEECHFKAGDSVLIQGTGNVSLFALLFAKAMKGNTYCTSSSDAKLEQIKAVGADHLLNYQSRQNWGTDIYQASNGGVDHVLDVGGSSTLKESLEAVKVAGHIALIGGLGGFDAKVSLFQIFIKQIRLSGMAVGNLVMQEQMVDFIDAHELKPIIAREFDLADLADAFRYQEAGDHLGKVVVTY